MSKVTTQQVRQFYDNIGWQQDHDGIYQNARYEDLRPVSSEYIHRCHLRLNRYLTQAGKFFLDAGSGPIQYPEYLTYSQRYEYRVCVDISIVALEEARSRIGNHGLFVVADITYLPFKSGVFSGEVSLHTLHHLQIEDQKLAYFDLYRTLKPGSSGVIVNGWTDSKLMRRSQWLITLMEKLMGRLNKQRQTAVSDPGKNSGQKHPIDPQATGTFVKKMDAAWIRSEFSGKIDLDIFVWRSVSVRFLRSVIHSQLGGKVFLKLLFWLEDRFPRYFGENGQYPAVIIHRR